jgi:hypothetical protein
MQALSRLNRWAAWPVLIGMIGFVVLYLAEGWNCDDSPVITGGIYVRQCLGPDLGNDPNHGTTVEVLQHGFGAPVRTEEIRQR